MATNTTTSSAADGFVTRKLLALTALIFLLNLPTITAWGTPTAKLGAALLYLGGAFVIASLGKLLILGVRHGPQSLTK